MSSELFQEVEEEVTSFLSGLIRINTTNPPGNETKAAKYVAEALEKDGFKCELIESEAGRGSVVTRLRGASRKPSLLLLSHLDVVAANATEWSVEPFSGLVEDGFVWGRGALDMKGMTAVEVMALKLLKRNNVKLKGDVILAATADEEKGGEAGAGWVVRNHPDKVYADYVLNEGAGMAMKIDGKNIFTINTAEKGILWFKVKAGGTPGHGSVPGAADNAILRMNKVVEKLGSFRPEISLVPTVKQYVSELAKSSEFRDLSVLLRNPTLSDQILDLLAQKEKYLAEELRARLRMTVTPTIIRGGVKENIIPSECEAVFDCRVLPGQNPANALSEIKRLLKDAGLDKLSFETVQANDPSESPLGTPLYKLMVKVLKEFEPQCSSTPVILTGGTDSRFFRRMGSVCYGFHPVRPETSYSEMQETIHGIDERISTENLVFGTSVLYNVIERFMS
ncbi:MAG TPA: M20/M25/M40 family metallo-hydrolase [candidate division Zixibacteria bacterium]|nr:M20/M25/M40 family metallo-hydrolase [candidate division Zixibacteria bacterium]